MFYLHTDQIVGTGGTVNAAKSDYIAKLADENIETPGTSSELEGTVEGVKCEEDQVFSVQYHPESAPGPQDSAYLFDQFISMMEKGKQYA